jgi:hypothetical protein
MVGLNLIFLALIYEGLLSSPHKVLSHFLIAGYNIKKPTIPNTTLLKLKLSERYVLVNDAPIITIITEINVLKKSFTFFIFLNLVVPVGIEPTTY